DWYESDVAVDLVGFLDAFYDKYPSLEANDLFIFGESYAGHYVPDFVYALLHRPASVANSPHANQIVNNLKGMVSNCISLGIGNGLTSPSAMFSTVGEFAAGISEGQLTAASPEELQKCHIGIQRCQEAAQGGFGDCSMLQPCDNIMANLLDQVRGANLNYYDLRAHCNDDDAFHLCYRFTPLYDFVNAPSTQAVLGIQDKTWTPCSHDVFVHYAQPLGKYMYNNTDVGELRHYNGLSFLRVYSSGHVLHASYLTAPPN
ncbi:hypothetical protein DYB37_004472, partial [Aphanomyces astaci]